MNRGPAVAAAAFAAAALAVGALAPVAGAAGAAGAAPAALPGRVVLSQAVPHVPAGSTQYGAPPSGQVLDLDVVLAGQDPAGLSQAVAAVSTPDPPTTGSTSRRPPMQPGSGRVRPRWPRCPRRCAARG